MATKLVMENPYAEVFALGWMRIDCARFKLSAVVAFNVIGNIVEIFMANGVKVDWFADGRTGKPLELEAEDFARVLESHMAELAKCEEEARAPTYVFGDVHQPQTPNSKPQTATEG